jgi:predicted RND superfamily exporter protein
MSTLLQRLTGLAARRPAVTTGIVLALAIAGGVLALGLRPSAAIDTFVSGTSPSYRATVTQQRLFGSNGVQILVAQPLTRLLQPAEMQRLTALEACLGGQYDTYDSGLASYQPAAAGAHAAYGGAGSPCGELRRDAPVKVVYGPATFLNRAVGAFNTDLQAELKAARATDRAVAAKAYKLAIGQGLSRAQAQQAGRAASAAEAQRQLSQLEGLAGSTGIDRTPSIRDPAFLEQLVLDPARGAGRPAARFQYLFPTAGDALIAVRLKQSLSDGQQARAIAAIRRAVAMPMFSLPGGRYTVTGETVVIGELAGQISGAIGTLLGVALVVMAIVLLLVFRRRRGAAGGVWLRLLPLALALAAVGITFGLLAVAGARLTVAAIAVLPILVGLAVDYAVQFQARVDEVASKGQDEGRVAVALAAARGGPPLATAALATAVAFLALELSPVPMVRGFGLLLVAGVAVALGCALTAGAAVLAMAIGGARPAGRPGPVAPSVRGAAELASWAPRRIAALVAPSVRGAGELVRGGVDALQVPRVAALPGRAVAGAARRPVMVLTAALALAIAGWAVSGQTRVQSDVTKLVPQGSRALRDLRTLERVSGVSGEVDVLVRGRDVATPATLRWMTTYQNEILRHFGYSAQRGCTRATLCPALSLTALFASLPGSGSGSGSGSAAGSASGAGSGSASGSGDRVTQARIRQLLATVPGYFTQTVLTPDHRAATLAFGIRLMPLARQQRVLDYMRSRLAPPPGVSATLTGLPVLAAQANGTLSSSLRRDEMLVAGLLAVALVLLVVLRSLRRALEPIVPIVLATGWSVLIVYATGIPLNPMSATLGALVIAISTEFSVLLSERYVQERALGADRDQALVRTYRLTGAAVLASGTTAIAGFAVLIVSPIEMLRQFGVVTLVDLTVSLAGVLLVLPAVLALGERRRGAAGAADGTSSGDAGGSGGLGGSDGPGGSGGSGDQAPGLAPARRSRDRVPTV